MAGIIKKETGLLFFLRGIFKHRGQSYFRWKSLFVCVEPFFRYHAWNHYRNPDK